MTGRLSISLHDVAPSTWPLCQALLAQVVPAGVPTTLLVVPRFHDALALAADAGLVADLRRRVAAGDEPVLHGYFHRDDAPAPRGPLGWVRRRLYTAGEGEFDAIAEPEAGRRLHAGTAELARVGLPPRAFVAPAWLLGDAAWRALARTPLEHTCSRDALIRVRDRACWPAPSLVWSARSEWRSRVARAWNAARLERIAAQPWVRVALHPRDATDARAVRFWAQAIGALARRRDAVLEFAMARELLPTAATPPSP